MVESQICATKSRSADAAIYSGSRALTCLFRQSTAGLALFLVLASPANGQFAFDQKSLQFNGNGAISSGTSLQFGPDGLLYVSEVDGDIQVFEIIRNGTTNEYEVVSSETIDLIQSIPNHNDDGSSAGGTSTRQVTGLEVGGSVGAVEVYVTSSDSRIGAGGGGGDAGLDTNSGVITRLTRNGAGWDAVDIVRGLPRSEENHAPNGLEIATIDSRDDNGDLAPDRFLIVSIGGLTNAGSPSNNFAFISEYALSGAVLAVNLDVLEDMPINIDGGRSYVYDLPTLDDPTRTNLNGIIDPDDPGYDGVDINDPFGGNDGLNQAKLVPGSPVEMFSPGYRNTYDLVVKQNGAVYVTDNGANGGWGGYPENEATPNVTNNYRSGEPGSNGTDLANGNEPQVNNEDHLNLVTTDIQTYTFGSIYGGHPSPIRANVNAGWYARGSHTQDPLDADGDGQTNGYFRTVPYDPDAVGEAADQNLALPADWPPVDPTLINTNNADFRAPGENNPDSANPAFAPFVDPLDDITVTTWQNNTNGIDEYTASNFAGALQGALIAGKSGGTAHIVTLDASGQLDTLHENFFSGLGGNPLGITAQGDSDLFPGTIWMATFNSNIVILEPNDFVICVEPGEPGYDPSADNDFDGYTNQDEEDNGTDPCSGASQPNDFDDDNISDLNDPDDDGDGINDASDAAQLGVPLNLNVENELFSDQLDGNGNTLGYLGLGLTGLMNNGAPNPNWLDWIDRTDMGTGPNDVLGGAIGAVTIQQTGGTAAGAANTQEKAFQYTVNVSTATGPFSVNSRMSGLTESGQLYPFTVDPGDLPPNQGIQIGTGFQDNYIEFVVTQSGLMLREEVNDSTAEQIITALSPAERPQAADEDIVLHLLVNPMSGAVEGQYSVNGAPPTSVGSITAEGAVLDAIQQISVELAVGLIGTSGAPNDPGNLNDDDEFAATWDTLFVVGSAPTILVELENIERLIDAPSDQLNLDNFFEDDGGPGNLTYSVEANSNLAIGASITGNVLTLSYPSEAATATITIRATDTDLFFAEQTFTVTVSDEPVPLVRINAGGASVPADDGGPTWEAGSAEGAYSAPSGAWSVNTGNTFAGNIPVSGRDASIPAYVSDSVFGALFTNERWDPAGAPEMQFSVTLPGGGPLPADTYEVRLYVGNGFDGTSAAGERVFGVNFEGGAQEISGLDLSGDFGHQVGAMVSTVVEVTDGVLNIEFIHDVENPLVNAIEVLGAPGAPLPISVSPISNQDSFETFTVSLPVVASGGNGALVYQATGLPTGLTIDTSTGVIGGTIATGAAALSPYTVEVTVDDSDSDPTDTVSETFSWSVDPAPDPGDILFRVNAGGPVLNDPLGDWQADTVASPSPYLDLSGASDNLTSTAALTGANPTIAPDALFTTERYSETAPPDNMQYDFPVSSGDYVVNLYFAEIWTGATDPGVRIFDVEIEGQPVVTGLDQTGDFGFGNAFVIEIPVTVADDNLDIDFIAVLQNPAIKGIEILSAGPPANPDAAAYVAINSGSGIDSSTFGGGFIIENNSTNGLEITQVSFDLSTALFPEMVFDPVGTAGDATAKCLETDATSGTPGLTTPDTAPDSCTVPFSGPRGNGGFDIITLEFNDFGPGESYEFAVDVDPTSIEGVAGSGGAGSVSGLELAGATVAVSFSDGTTTLVNELYRIQPASEGGSENLFLPESPGPAPGLLISGAVLAGGSPPGVQNATVGSLSPTAQVSAPAGSNVTLLLVAAEKTVAITDPFEANAATSVSEFDAVVGASGTINIPLTLTDSGPDELNYLAAVVVLPDGRTSPLSTIWRINYDPAVAATSQALIQVNPGAGLAASTFNPGSFIIENLGDDSIVSVTFDLTTALLPDVVFDPNGTAGDSGAKCLEDDSGSAATGFVTPTDPCTDPFSSPHNGANGDDGYDELTVAFTDFGNGETFTFSTDNDPTSIKNDTTSGDAGAISGFELIGSTITVEFASGAILQASLFDEGSLGGSMAIVEAGALAAPALSLVGNTAPIALPDPNQSILVSGTPGSNVWLLQVDARLYIDAGGGGFDIDPFEANDAMAKVLANVTIEGDGDTEVPVTLLATASGDAGPAGGINHFIASEDGPTAVKSLTSNIVVVEYDPTVVIGNTLEGTILLQGRTDHSGDITVTLYDLAGVQVGSPVVVTADSNGDFSVPDLAVGTFQVAVKPQSNLQVVDTVEIVAGTNTFDFGTAPTGDANGDNQVNIIDFSVLVATFGLMSGEPGFNPNADFDGNGQVNIVDFSLLVSTFGQLGDSPSSP